MYCQSTVHTSVGYVGVADVHDVLEHSQQGRKQGNQEPDHIDAQWMPVLHREVVHLRMSHAPASRHVDVTAMGHNVNRLVAGSDGDGQSS